MVTVFFHLLRVTDPRSGSGLLTPSDEVDPMRLNLSRVPGSPAKLSHSACAFATAFLLLLLGICHLPTAAAASPTLDHLFPVTVQPGATNAITAIGKFDPWPVKVWVDTPDITFQAETNSGKFQVTVATNTPPGPHLVRVYNEQGVSEPKFLIVTRDPQQTEQEPNDDFRSPQKLDQFPVTLNGRLEKSGDVDSFSVSLNTGQTLVASLEAYTLGSPMDAVLRLIDARGVQVALNHDDGRTLDPLLVWTATVAGAYVLQIFSFAYPADSSVVFTGNAKCVYRLHAWRGACARYTLPLGVQRGAKTAVRVVGWNTAGEPAREFDGLSLPPGALTTTWRVPGFENDLELPVGDGPELVEPESNGALATTNRLHLPVPGAVTGAIGKIGEEDRYSFSAKKGDKLLVELQSASLGFPLDAWVKIEDSKSKELARAEDGINADPQLEWNAPADGDYALAVGTVLHRGGPEYLYRASLRHPAPALKATVAATSLTLEAGKTNEVKITLARQFGQEGKLSVFAMGLPEGVSTKPEETAEKAGDATLKLIATPEAKPFSGPIRFVVKRVDTGTEQSVIAELVVTTINNGVPNGYAKLVIESTDQIWLTVTKPPPPPAPKEAKP